MMIVKIGGSVITDKSTYRSFKPEVMSRISSILKVLSDEIIVIHGAGSFGHIKAAEFGLPSTKSLDKMRGYSIIHRDVMELNLKIIDNLITAGLNPITVSPADTFGNRASTERILAYHKSGFLPVSHGDVFLRENKLEIISGDTLVFILAKKLRPTRVIFLSDVDGVFSSDPKINHEGRLLKNLDGEIDFRSRITDVTGGMRLKVETMRSVARYCQAVYLINGNFPERLLQLDEPSLIGTRIQGMRIR